MEQLDYADFLTRYDGDGTLFYLDPPYLGCENDYGKGLFSRDEFARMAEQLRGLKGRFILSLNDVPQVRQTFASFTLSEVKTTCTISPKKAAKGPRRELIIINFELP